MSKIWITSDTHYNHKNIVSGTTEWAVEGDGSSHSGQQLRDFDTLEEHNNALVDNINSLVKADDVLYHLGDWSFGGIGSIWEFRKRINCRTIHLIYGNHDEHIEKNKQLVIPGEEYALCDKLDLLYDNIIGSSFYTGMQCLFSSVASYREIRINKQIIVMSHFAMRVWNKCHKGSIMLYGHSHGSLPEEIDRRSMDVGVDTNNLMPYALDDIVTRLNERPVLYVDHHTAETN